MPASTPGAHRQKTDGPRARRFVSGEPMADLIAKTAIDRRLAEIVGPVIEGLGFELIRLRLMGGNTRVKTTLGSPNATIAVDDVRGFTADPELAALVVDLEEEIERLRAQLRRLGQAV